MSAILSTSLQALWDMINNLQLVSHTPLFNIAYTANILMFLKTLVALSNFNLFNVNSWIETVFKLKPEEEYDSYNYYFDFLGYECTNFIYLLGLPIFLIFVYFGLMLIYIVILPFKYKR